jgi:UDP-2-acetamido-2,6-beta-L-arabino-hexul-4-ose reductase
LKILVTGSKGFIGKNLVAELRNRNAGIIFEYDIDTGLSLLEEYCKETEFLFHLAGINRPENPNEYIEGNIGFTSLLAEMLEKYKNNCPIVFASSIQADLENPYGKSKKAAEDLLLKHGEKTGAKVFIYRLPNIFGKWCKPNYNSVIATFCHNIANDLPIRVNDPETVLSLAYIDDVVDEMIGKIGGKQDVPESFCNLRSVYTKKLGEISELIYSFRKSRENHTVPDMSDPLTKKLYSTYLSYLPENSFKYALKMNIDSRGSFTEFLKTPERGQVSVNISKPGVIKGNHWHNTKNEKFLVVSGKGVIRLRNIFSDEVKEYFVDGIKLEVIDIPPGYTHNIENLGDTDMVTIMWANECFDPEKPDTYYLEV